MSEKILKALSKYFLLFFLMCTDVEAVSMQPYIGGFGGGGSSLNGDLSQQGTSYLSAYKGGPLYVNAQGGALSNSSVGIAGAHLGYRVQGKQFIPALELEGYYLTSKQRGQLINPTPRVPEHIFEDTFPMDMGIFIANTILNINTNELSIIEPYVGAGVGTGFISLSGANSEQIRPAEPYINHFNSNPDATDWTFAAQAKAGLHYHSKDTWSLLTEYRFLYLAPTQYTFGSTQYSGHAATSNWRIHFGRMINHLAVVGFEYKI